VAWLIGVVFHSPVGWRDVSLTYRTLAENEKRDCCRRRHHRHHHHPILEIVVTLLLPAIRS